MATQNFTTSISVGQSPEQVFNAINNVRGWWSGEIEGNTDQLNDEFSYRVGDVHFSKQRIIELIPFSKILWQVTESNLSFVADKSEWTGTKISFEIVQEGNQTKLVFSHLGLVPAFECYNGCSSAWTQLVQESLFSLITTGKGKKIF